MSLKILLHLKCVATLLHYLEKCQCLKATTENKTTSVTQSEVAVIVKLFNVSTLLPNDALLKCVITKVVLFSIVAFKTLTFHKEV